MGDKASYSEPGEKVEQHAANVSSIICGKERTGKNLLLEYKQMYFSFGMLNCHSSKF